MDCLLRIAPNLTRSASDYQSVLVCAISYDGRPSTSAARPSNCADMALLLVVREASYVRLMFATVRVLPSLGSKYSNHRSVG